jgi:prepilin-type processing-associated H-X9-DG protein
MNDPYMVKYDFYNEVNQPRPLPIPGALASYIGFKLNTSGSVQRTALQAQISANPYLLSLFTCPGNKDPDMGATNSDTIGWDGMTTPNSYSFNEEALGWTGSGAGNGFHRLAGKLSMIPRPSENEFMGDGNQRQPVGNAVSTAVDLLKSFTGSNQIPGPDNNQPPGQYFGTAFNCTMQDVFLSDINRSSQVFDWQRHVVSSSTMTGKMNIVFFDGHVGTFTFSMRHIAGGNAQLIAADVKDLAHAGHTLGWPAFAP